MKYSLVADIMFVAPGEHGPIWPDEAGLCKAMDLAKSNGLQGIELFDFEGQVYHSALIPSGISRIEKQIRSVAPWVEKILCYEYPGILARPGSVAAYAGSEPARLYGELELLQNKR